MNFNPLFRSRLSLFIGGLLIIMLSATSALTQSGTSSVRGTVQDAQGNVIAGATVTLKNDEKNFARTQVSNDGGSYVFTAVPPDTYVLEVEANGFKKAIVPAFEALVDTPKTVDVPLEVGQLTESVTVSTSTEAQLNTIDGTLGNTFNQQKVIDLPLPSRETVGLLSLQPGVTRPRSDDPSLGGAVNGGRSDQANVTLDGVDVNEQQGGASFFSTLRVTPESLQEFRVTTTNANADQGRSSGAQISLITRSGNNDFHGSGYLYYRPKTAFQANDFFNNRAGVDQPAQERRNFGGSFLGPIIKDKLFFAFFYERFEENREEAVTREVPLATLGQGIVRYRSANGASDPGCPAGTPSGVQCLTIAEINAGYTAANGGSPGINPFALSALAAAASRYQANDLSGEGDGLNTGGFRFNAPIPVRNNATTIRLDSNITKNQTLFGRYQFQFDNSAGVPRFPDTAAPNTWSHPQGLAAGHTWTINSNAVNRFTYGFTRDAFTRGGDSSQNAVSFRFIYAPENFTRTLRRITPVHNFVDDFTYTWGNHTISTGANIRLISNNRISTAASFDNATTNPSFYDESGDVVIFSGGASIFPNVASGSFIDLRDALTAVIGRFSQYGANLQFARDGSLLPAGAGIGRTFKTEEYEFYAQDSWRIRNNLTLNYGLRYSTSTPVYEADGLQVKPTTSLNDFFNNRVAAANNGSTYNQLLTVDLAGKANGKDGFYKQDFNNFAPSISFAYSPGFKNGILRTIFGGEGKSTIRGGFRMTYDRVGSALAVAFDLNSTLGFSSSAVSAANSFNVSDRLAPLFTGFGQQIRNPLFFGNDTPVGALPTSLNFPLQTAADDAPRIEQSLDDKLTTPYNYNFNLSFGREIFGGIVVEASYVGRIAKNLLVSRDTAHFNNIRDPQSGEDFYGVMRRLINFREANAPITSIPNIPWFNRFVPGLAGVYNVCGLNVNLTATQAAYRRVARPTVNGATGTQCIGGRNTTDYTFIQQGIWNFTPIASVDNLFVHPQYATFAAYTTAGDSSYHGGQLSIRKRFGNGLAFDFNYTYAHSLDTASGTEAGGSSPTAISSGASLILNPLDLNENRGSSDFDVRHLINANLVYQLPFGRGRTFFGNANKYVNAIIGGFTITGIYRWNTGFPIGQPFDDGRWATNWNVQSNAVALQRFETNSNTTGDVPNLFGDPTAAYLSYRNAYPGEAGDRNILREPNYISLDLGLQKNFKITETNNLQFRMEVFNVTNTQRFTGIESFGLRQDPFLAQIQAQANGETFTAPDGFGNFTRIQGEPRVVQFVVRYDF